MTPFLSRSHRRTVCKILANQSRLESLSPELARAVEDASAAQRHDAALAASALAVEQTGLRNVAVDAALQELRGNGTVDDSRRSELYALVEELDEAYWDTQELVESGSAAGSDALSAFRQARAAASVAFATETGARTAALEGLYEAVAALDDVAAVVRATASALGEPEPPEFRG